MSEKLLPCPFCGSEAGIAGDGTSWEVGCSADECYVSMFDINRERAIVSWNKRAIDSLPTYYILRRTVGETTMHHEYFNGLDGFTLFMNNAIIADNSEDLEIFVPKWGGEIISIKLVVVVAT